jgi:peptidoglycan/xylan/chitin deacetylase (PgdA/CDA1 family)
MRTKIINAGFSVFRTSRLDRLMAPVTRGLGTILTFHQVRPEAADTAVYRPNRPLEITPAFFEAILIALRQNDFEIVDLDTALERIAAPPARPQRRFAVITFDDGYRDNRDHALPILERYSAPFTLYVTTGFAERTAHLWWRELELSVARATEIDLTIGQRRLQLPAVTDAEKTRAFATVLRHLRSGSEERFYGMMAALCRRYDVDGRALLDDMCLDFDEIAALAEHPLCTIGAHTVTHPRLAKQEATVAYRELADSRDIIAARIGREVRHLAYPIGDPVSAGAREFAMAREIGYASAVTTRPGMLFAEHAMHPTALPRLSVNGRWPEIDYFELLLSGAPFALWNGGRRVNVA